ncbi:hypothetical protein C7M84_008779 [Penaeus vannamei]|uniref:Uncharacterized protein n=1 Tax=Penaeus vannamei TaxID=6689 RepID=A0A3R7QN66_PENVA|nr:hypothetical protein C7M84_008779 [Penaeus vannamei]
MSLFFYCFLLFFSSSFLVFSLFFLSLLFPSFSFLLACRLLFLPSYSFSFSLIPSSSFLSILRRIILSLPSSSILSVCRLLLSSSPVWPSFSLVLLLASPSLLPVFISSRPFFKYRRPFLFFLFGISSLALFFLFPPSWLQSVFLPLHLHHRRLHLLLPSFFFLWESPRYFPALKPPVPGRTQTGHHLFLDITCHSYTLMAQHLSATNTQVHTLSATPATDAYTSGVTGAPTPVHLCQAFSTTYLPEKQLCSTVQHDAVTKSKPVHKQRHHAAVHIRRCTHVYLQTRTAGSCVQACVQQAVHMLALRAWGKACRHRTRSCTSGEGVEATTKGKQMKYQKRAGVAWTPAHSTSVKMISTCLTCGVVLLRRHGATPLSLNPSWQPPVLKS